MTPADALQSKKRKETTRSNAEKKTANTIKMQCRKMLCRELPKEALLFHLLLPPHPVLPNRRAMQHHVSVKHVLLNSASFSRINSKSPALAQFES